MSEGRLGRSLVASALLHAAALALIVRSFVPSLAPPRVFPIALVGTPGGGGGPAGPASDAAPPAPEPAPPLPAATAPPPRPHREHAVARRPSRPAATPPVAGTDASASARDGTVGATGTGASGGGGDGSGGDGSGGARVAYGANPLPPYPLVARRLGKEGLVLLDVLVAPDGRAADVRVAQTSGFAALDDSAATTVRQRWRFVPARRGGEAVAARVTVPIRFRLDDSRG